MNIVYGSNQYDSHVILSIDYRHTIWVSTHKGFKQGGSVPGEGLPPPPQVAKFFDISTSIWCKITAPFKIIIQWQ